MNLKFSRTHRLLNAHDFANVLRAKKSSSNAFFQVAVIANSLGHARLGLIVAKKVSKRANRRNYIKRTVRECFRLQQHKLASVDLVVRARRVYSHAEYNEATQALTELFKKLAYVANTPASDSSLPTRN